MLASVRADSPITAMVAELDRTQVRAGGGGGASCSPGTVYTVWLVLHPAPGGLLIVGSAARAPGRAQYVFHVMVQTRPGNWFQKCRHAADS